MGGAYGWRRADGVMPVRVVGGEREDKPRGATVVKEIKAYIRRSALAPVLDALRRAGAPEVGITEAHLAGPCRDSDAPCPRAEGGGGYGLRDALRLEVLCADQDAERLVRAVLAAGESVARGDMLVVSDVARGVRIGDLAPGEEVLARTI